MGGMTDTITQGTRLGGWGWGRVRCGGLVIGCPLRVFRFLPVAVAALGGFCGGARGTVVVEGAKGISCTGVTAMYGLGWPGGVSGGGVRYHTGIPKVKLGRERVAMTGTE